MNPNLPVGGSAFDDASSRGIADPTGLTSLGLSFSYSFFDRHFAGSDAVPSSFTDQLDAFMFGLNANHYVTADLLLGLRVPIAIGASVACSGTSSSFLYRCGSSLLG